MRIVLRIFLALAVLQASSSLFAAAETPSREYVGFVLKSCDRVEGEMEKITQTAETMAKRHLAGGQLGLHINGNPLPEEICGRSGGVVHLGFDRPFKTDRTDAEKKNDIAFASWVRPPADTELAALKTLKGSGCMIIGFGPKAMPQLAEIVKTCDVWFDTGFGADDLVIHLPHQKMSGDGNLVVETLQSWALIGEFVSALTRQGKMPTMYKSYVTPGGREWGDKYFLKKQFHDDYKIAPIPDGKLARDFLGHIRGLVERFRDTQLTEVNKAADMIATEFARGRKTLVATSGHMPYTFVCHYGDQEWAETMDIHASLESQMKSYEEQSREGALVLRIGYAGMHTTEIALYKKKKQTVMLIVAEHPDKDWQPPADLPVRIEMGYAYGDACVPIEGYPIKILPPSGIMQLVAYKCVEVEVESRLAAKSK